MNYIRINIPNRVDIYDMKTPERSKEFLLAGFDFANYILSKEYNLNKTINVRLQPVTSGGRINLNVGEVYVGYKPGVGHIHAAGRARGNNVDLHNGYIGAGRGNGTSKQFYTIIFKNDEDLGETLLHEILHTFGFGHSADSRCLMYQSYKRPTTSMCRKEADYLINRYGLVDRANRTDTNKPQVMKNPYIPPKPDPDTNTNEDRIKELLAEKQELWYERIRINERIKVIEEEISKLQSQQFGSMMSPVEEIEYSCKTLTPTL